MTRSMAMPTMWRLGDRSTPTGPHVAVVPGTQVPLLPLKLPEKLSGMARERVAERQLVETLSMPVQGFEMRPFAPKGIKQWTRSLVVDAGLAESWRKSLKPGCIALMPDYLMLPTGPDLWTVERRGDQVLARLAAQDGFSAEPDLALAMLAEHQTTPKAVLRLGDADAELDALLDALNVPIVRDAAELRDKGVRLMRWTEASGGIDLKDPPSAVIDRLRTRILRWRVPVISAVLAVSVWCGAMFVQTQNLRQNTAQDQALTRDLVRAHFVPNGPILDIRAQVTAALETAQGPSDDIAESMPALTQLQIAASLLTLDGLQLQTASYRDDTGLVATVAAANFAALDQLTADLADAGFAVNQLDSRAQQSGGVVARLKLELVP